MRKPVTIAACVVALSAAGGAAGADLPARGAPPAPVFAAAPLSWAGFYGGVNAGYDWGRSHNDWSISSVSPILAAFPALVTVTDAAGSLPMNENGGSFGGQAGYLWQVSPMVVAGLEANLDFGGMRGGLDQNLLLPNPPGGTFSQSQRLSMSWNAGLRARIGVAPADGLLVYGHGGLAVAGLRYSSAFSDSYNENEAIDRYVAKPGWVAGLGVEYAFDNHWSARLEYAHSQFAALKATGSGLLADGSTAYVAHSSGALSVESVRFGVNYRLGQ